MTTLATMTSLSHCVRLGKFHLAALRRLAAERFGFPAGSMICKACYEKWRYRHKNGMTKVTYEAF